MLFFLDDPYCTFRLRRHVIVDTPIAKEGTPPKTNGWNPKMKVGSVGSNDIPFQRGDFQVPAATFPTVTYCYKIYAGPK